MEESHRIILRVISYILLPLFVTLAILSCFCIVIVENNSELMENTNYYETTMFSDLYSNSIIQNVRECLKYQDIIMQSEDVLQVENQYSSYEIQENVDILGENGIIYYKPYLEERNFKFLIIDKENHRAYTNLAHTMKTDSIEEIKQSIMENNKYWSFEDGNIDTSIERLNLENIRYTSGYTELQESYKGIIFTSIENDLPYQDQFYEGNFRFNVAKQWYEPAIILLPTSSIFSILLIIAIIIGMSGTSKKTKLNWFDRIPLEVIIILLGILMGIGATFLSLLGANSMVINTVGISITAIVWYITFILGLETFVKRLKTHTFLKNTILYRCFNFMIKNFKNMVKNFNIVIRLAIFLGIWLVINTILTYGMRNNVFISILIIAFWGASFWYVFTRMGQFKELYYIIRDLYEGNTKININENNYRGILKELAIYLKDIAGGFSNAMEEGIKSERLKTELITNVSHDIKTPLTSIINYVDLLKKEEMPNEKSKQYLEILDNKSQRLKKLTEDLVEASKASSGNIKLNMERLNIKELLKQVSGEFKDKFVQRDLEEIIILPNEDLYIQADSRYLYRVLENLYSNISKYALENSRVYIEAKIKQDKVVIEMKNISKEKLNISVDELMQRFVRGDSARNTEGSGLGLSIATSLTQLQNGTFNIYLDGDLFKVILEFSYLSNNAQ